MRRHSGGGLLACFAALLAAMLLPAGAAARPGALDPTFGTRGRIATATSVESTSVRLATARDSSIAVARGSLVFRYLPNGQPDDRFGDDGQLEISSVEGLSFEIADVAIDDAGRVLVFGTATDPSITRELPAYFVPAMVHPSFAVVLRLDSAGSLDPGFGGGDGIFRGNLGLRPIYADLQLVGISAAELDSEQRPVMAVGKIGFPPSEGRSRPGWVTKAVARLTAFGEVDPTFGGGDGVVEGLGGATWTYEDFCISNLDRPVFASEEVRFHLQEEKEEDPAVGMLERLQADGTRDQTFGSGGLAYAIGGVGPLTCDPVGRITMVQRNVFPQTADAPAWKLVRLAANGRVNHRFGRRARAAVKKLGRAVEPAGLTADRRGRVLLAETLKLPRRGGKTPRSFFTVIRLLASGKPDRHFGHGGWVRTGFGRRATIDADEAALDASGHLVVAGHGHAPWLQPAGVVLARYLLGR